MSEMRMQRRIYLKKSVQSCLINRYFGEPITMPEMFLYVVKYARTFDKIICNCNCEVKFIILTKFTICKSIFNINVDYIAVL